MPTRNADGKKTSALPHGFGLAHFYRRALYVDQTSRNSPGGLPCLRGPMLQIWLRARFRAKSAAAASKTDASFIAEIAAGARTINLLRTVRLCGQSGRPDPCLRLTLCHGVDLSALQAAPEVQRDVT